MKISELIQKLEKARCKYGDLDVTVSETLWLYNSVQSVQYIKNPYEDSEESCIEIVDYESHGDDWYEVL